MSTSTEALVRVASVAEVRAAGRLVAQADGPSLVLLAAGAPIHALDNRCPHMGFPLHRGTLQDGILTCHWHHARFDLESGGAVDRWGGDVGTFPGQMRGREGGDPPAPCRSGLGFGVWHRRDGWGRGLTILGCMRHLLPRLNPEDRPRALYHGLSAVAEECAGQPPRFAVRPLPTLAVTPALLRQGYRQL